MPDLDVDRAREYGVAVPPASAAEYAEKANQLQPGYTATADATDPSVGWTVQHRDAGRDGTFSNFVDPGSTLPGQVYLPEQLPDPELAVAVGMPPVKIPEHLITDDADHIQGPEPSESAIAERRGALRASVLAYTESTKDDGVFTPDEAPATTESSTPPADPTLP